VAERLEQARAFIPLYNRGGIEAVLSMFDPDVTWMAPPEWMDAPVYCGHRGIRDLDALWRSNFDDFGLELEEVRAVGERVVTLLTLRGLIKGTRQPIAQRASWVVDFNAEGLVTLLRAYFSWDEALTEATRT
jgi:ketosteroid isomerase-like protein